MCKNHSQYFDYLMMCSGKKRVITLSKKHLQTVETRVFKYCYLMNLILLSCTGTSFHRNPACCNVLFSIWDDEASCPIPI